MLLLTVNSTYFYKGVGAIAEINQIVLRLYDGIVMSTTYSQNVRNDLTRFSAQLTWSLIEETPGAVDRHERVLNEFATSFGEDLAVVRERQPSPEYAVQLDELDKRFQHLQGIVKDLLTQARQLDRKLAHDPGRRDEAKLKLARAWANNSERVALIDLATDVNDKLVADGYNFRVSSVTRTELIKSLSIVVSLAIILLNIACLAFVFATILPRLKRLTQLCREIADGNFSKRVYAHADDTNEFGQLAKAFNVMLEALRMSEARVASQLRTTNAMMDSLGQGFLIFDAKGTCSDVFSRACLELLERDPKGKSIAEVLQVPTESATDFRDWIDVLFTDFGTFEDVAQLGPSNFVHSEGRSVSLAYRPIRDAQGHLHEVMLVATDKTDEVRARSEAGREQEFSAMILKLTRNRLDFVRFLQDARRMLKSLETAPLNEAKRILHTLKGGAAAFSLKTIKETCHAQESLALAEGHNDPARVRELRDLFESTLADLEGQLGIPLLNVNPAREIPEQQLEAFYGRLRDPGVRRDFRQEFILEPIARHIARFNESISELAERQFKQIGELVIEGGDLRIDVERYRHLLATLVHVFRNAVDHGVETPEERVALGKDPTAHLVVTIARESNDMLIRIKDDGRGINVARLRERLASRGASVDAASDAELIQHVFDGGVSTANSVTEISGRGVGLDAVLAEAQRLGGEAWIESQFGNGTTTCIRVPIVDDGLGLLAA